MRVMFKNFEKSELALEAVHERLGDLVQKFSARKVTVTLSMENSPRHPGADLFEVKALMEGAGCRRVLLRKSASSLYAALADVREHLLEVLNRSGDKARVLGRARRRRLRQNLPA